MSDDERRLHAVAPGETVDVPTLDWDNVDVSTERDEAGLPVALNEKPKD